MELLDALGVGARASNRPTQLSGGEQQRVTVARALANQPSLILADEPTAALDSVRGRQVMELFRDVAHEHGTGVIVVTHDHRALDVFDTVYEMEDGGAAFASGMSGHQRRSRRFLRPPPNKAMQPAGPKRPAADGQRRWAGQSSCSSAFSLSSQSRLRLRPPCRGWGGLSWLWASASWRLMRCAVAFAESVITPTSGRVRRWSSRSSLRPSMRGTCSRRPGGCSVSSMHRSPRCSSRWSGSSCTLRERSWLIHLILPRGRQEQHCAKRAVPTPGCATTAILGSSVMSSPISRSGFAVSWVANYTQQPTGHAITQPRDQATPRAARG
jgi:energy-coupling factor transporter ATP-binding protein EcfA2